MKKFNVLFYSKPNVMELRRIFQFLEAEMSDEQSDEFYNKFIYKEGDSWNSLSKGMKYSENDKTYLPFFDDNDLNKDFENTTNIEIIKHLDKEIKEFNINVDAEDLNTTISTITDLENSIENPNLKKDLNTFLEVLKTKAEMINQVNPPYIITKATIKQNVHHSYNPKYGDNKECECGDPYYRHFDSYEDMYPCGCKYCGCSEFKPKKDKDSIK